MADAEAGTTEPTGVEQPTADPVPAESEPAGGEVGTTGEERRTSQGQPEQRRISGPAAPQDPGPLPKQNTSGGDIEPKPEERKSSKGGKRASQEQKRRPSMFEEVKDAKALYAVTGGEINDTLEAFFSHKTNSADNMVRKPVRRPKRVYENTYRLEPTKPFFSATVQTCIQNTLEELLDKVKYNSATVIHTCASVAEKIRARVLSLDFERYKILVHVTIGPMDRQGVYQGFRCLWDSNRDTYANAIFRNHNIYASAIVYAVYYE